MLFKLIYIFSLIATTTCGTLQSEQTQVLELFQREFKQLRQEMTHRLDNLEKKIGLQNAVQKRGQELIVSELSDKRDTCGECPDGFVCHANSCYYFSYSMQSQSAAQSVCESKGASLAVVGDDSEQQFIVSVLLNERYRPGTCKKDYTDLWGFWISGSRNANNKWAHTGSATDTVTTNDNDELTYSKWRASEPNNSGGNEDCIQILARSGGLWNDKKCNYQTSFVCELPAERNVPV